MFWLLTSLLMAQEDNRVRPNEKVVYVAPVTINDPTLEIYQEYINSLVVSDLERKNNSKRIIIFEESLAWYLGYDYALKRGIEIDLQEYAEKIEIALNLYMKEIKWLFINRGDTKTFGH